MPSVRLKLYLQDGISLAERLAEQNIIYKSTVPKLSYLTLKVKKKWKMLGHEQQN